MGLPLNNLKDIRCFYGENPFGTNEINFEKPPIPPRPKGHVIAARITSENPDEVRLCSLFALSVMSFHLTLFHTIPDMKEPEKDSL